MERLHGVVDDLVVHGAAKQRMRMAHKRGVAGLCLPLVQQRFQAPGVTGKEEGFDPGRHDFFIAETLKPASETAGPGEIRTPEIG